MKFFNRYILLLILISFIVLRPVFSNDFYFSHDGVAHVARFAAYFKAFTDGQIPPRWAADLNSGYGSPLFIFFYPLPGYLASLIHLLGFNFETIFKIIISLSFILSPIFLFFWLREKAKEEIAFAVSVIYLVLPYRILDTLVRGDVAELLGFVFMPLIFLSIDRTQKYGKLKDLIFGGMFYSFFILSHNAIAFIFTPVFLAYSFVFAKERKEFIFSLYIFLLGILISCFFWLPSIAEDKYVYAKLFVENIYKNNFIPLWNLIYSPWGFGPDINIKGGLSAQIGVLYTVIPFLALIFINKLKMKKEIFFWVFIFIISVFMTTSFSGFLWNKLPIIKLMQFPWRFTALSGFASCMIIFYFFKILKSQAIILVITFLFVFTSLPFVRVKGYEKERGDSFYYSYQGTTDYHRRTTSIWTEGDFGKRAKRQIEIIGGKATIINFKKRETLHTFDILADTNTQILDNTVYFPGWRVKVDGREVLIEFQDMNHRGLITFRIPKGRHSISIEFKETKDRILADFISVVAIISALGLLSIGSRRIRRE